jgi:hypothetical protein
MALKLKLLLNWRAGGCCCLRNGNAAFPFPFPLGNRTTASSSACSSSNLFVGGRVTIKSISILSCSVMVSFWLLQLGLGLGLRLRPDGGRPMLVFNYSRRYLELRMIQLSPLVAAAFLPFLLLQVFLTTLTKQLSRMLSLNMVMLLQVCFVIILAAPTSCYIFFSFFLNLHLPIILSWRFINIYAHCSEGYMPSHNRQVKRIWFCQVFFTKPSCRSIAEDERSGKCSSLSSFMYHIGQSASVYIHHQHKFPHYNLFRCLMEGTFGCTTQLVLGDLLPPMTHDLEF